MSRAAPRCAVALNALALGLVLALPRVAAADEPLREETAIERLLAGNDRFRRGVTRRTDVVRRQALVAGQTPCAVILSCSDSRVPPEIILDQGLGDLFVIRNAGNVVDAFNLASVEYAAEHLHVRELVVLGHTQCGAVGAAIEYERAGGKPTPPGHLELLLPHMGEALRALLRQDLPTQLLGLRAAEANVRHSLHDLKARSRMLSEIVERGELSLHGALYELESGRVALVDAISE